MAQYERGSKAKEPAAAFTQRINDKCAQVQADRDANRGPYHAVANIEDGATVDTTALSRHKPLSAVVDHADGETVAKNLVRRIDSCHDRSESGKTSSTLTVNGWQHGCYC